MDEKMPLSSLVKSISGWLVIETKPSKGSLCLQK